MNEQNAIVTIKKIEAYILGDMSDQEIDLLWIEFLRDPEWYDFFETELSIRSGMLN